MVHLDKTYREYPHSSALESLHSWMTTFGTPRPLVIINPMYLFTILSLNQSLYNIFGGEVTPELKTEEGHSADIVPTVC